MFIKKYPSSLSDRFLNEVTSLPVHSITSIDVVPIPKDMTTKVLQKKYLGIEADIIKQQRVRNRNNDFSTEISYAKRTEKKEIESIMDDVRENDQCLFYVAVTIIIVAESMEAIQSRIIENGRSGKATWLYIDECHVLLSSDYSAAYLQQLWKKVRKQGGLCTGISQNVTDLLQNYIAATLISNSEFVALLKQSNIDSAKLSEVIGVSDAQFKFVSNSPSGTGLMKCGNMVIPFDNTIEKDTALYKLYNTNIHEKIAEGLGYAEDDTSEFVTGADVETFESYVTDDVMSYNDNKKQVEKEVSGRYADTWMIYG